jgi:hypothetical protein
MERAQQHGRAPAQAPVLAVGDEPSVGKLISAHLAKPMSPRELLARIRAPLRRTRLHETFAYSVTSVHAWRWTIDSASSSAISEHGCARDAQVMRRRPDTEHSI